MKIKIKVIPRAKKERIKEEDGIIKIYTSKPPVDGKANKSIVQMLADYLNVKKNAVTITQGLRSHNKIVEIDESKR